MQLPRRCVAGGDDVGCLSGHWAATGKPGQCALAGVSWTCPPAFVADLAHEDSEPGTPVCVPDITACPPGKWGGLTGAGTQYVDPTAPPGGDGTKATPYNSLAAALKTLPSGGTLALADGVYEASVTLTKPVQLVGRCPGTVTLVAKPGKPVVTVNGAGGPAPARLESLRLTGDGPGLVVNGQLPVLGKRLYIDRPWYRGAEVLGAQASLTLEDTVIVGVRAHVNAASSGMGFAAWQGASAVLRRVHISRCTLRGITLEDPDSTIDGNEVVVERVQMSANSVNSGDAIVALGGARLRLRGARLARNARGGLLVHGAKSSAAVAGLALTGGAESDGGWKTIAVVALDGSRLTFSGGRLNSLKGGAIAAANTGTVARVGGVLVSEVLTSKGAPGAILAYARGRIEVLASKVIHIHGSGVWAGHEGTEATVADTLIVDCDDAKGSADGIAGIYISGGATAQIRSTRLSSNTVFGLAIDGKKASVVADGLLVDDTRSSQHINVEVIRPAGIWVGNAGRLNLRDARISLSRYAGLQVHYSAVVEAAGLLLEYGQPVLLESLFLDGSSTTEVRSHGITILFGGRVTLAGGRSTRMISHNILVAHAGSALLATGLVVDHTLAELNGKKWGLGMQAEAGGKIHCAACSLVRNRGSSAMVRTDGTLELIDSVVRDSAGQPFSLPGGEPVELADAVVVRDAGKADVRRCLLADNPRSGLMVVLNGRATAHANAITRNGYGLVSEGKVALDATDNALWDNSLANLAVDQGLQLPAAPGVLAD